MFSFTPVLQSGVWMNTVVHRVIIFAWRFWYWIRPSPCRPALPHASWLSWLSEAPGPRGLPHQDLQARHRSHQNDGLGHSRELTSGQHQSIAERWDARGDGCVFNSVWSQWHDLCDTLACGALAYWAWFWSCRWFFVEVGNLCGKHFCFSLLQADLQLLLKQSSGRGCCSLLNSCWIIPMLAWGCGRLVKVSTIRIWSNWWWIEF